MRNAGMGGFHPRSQVNQMLVNSDGVANYGTPTYLATATDSITGNFAMIFAHEAAQVDITSSLYVTSGDGVAPTNVAIPAGSYYVCPGATVVTLDSGKVTVYGNIES